MKVRTGHVANSSSASFVLCKYEITEVQLQEILAHAPDTGWSITVKHGLVKGDTSMDNYCWENFFKKIGINPEIVINHSQGW